MFDWILQQDTALFYVCNVKMANSFFDIVMPLVTNFRNWIPCILVFWGVLFYANKKSALRLLLLIVVAVCMADFLNSGIIKDFFARKRPCVVLPDARLLRRLTSTFSFPSSHAVNISCAATIVCLCFRRLSVVFASVFVVFLIGFSRVYIGVHYPLDVFFGYLEGWFIGYFVFFVWILGCSRFEKRRVTG